MKVLLSKILGLIIFILKKFYHFPHFKINHFYITYKLTLTNNSLVAVCLLPLIFSPFLVYFYSDDIFNIFFSILLIFLIQIFMYLFVLKLTSKND